MNLYESQELTRKKDEKMKMGIIKNNMLKNEPKQKRELIKTSYTKEDIGYKRFQYDDFVSRIDFINRTGVFITSAGYDIVYDSFKESGVELDEFLDNYEEKYCAVLDEKKELGLLYELFDFSGLPLDATVYELLNFIDEQSQTNLMQIIGKLDAKII